ncbi:MAG: RNA polymerase sigma factor [Actinobacteria bacterium]|nr:RNA polymerase sigma factor [Actinomycetota bacterium]
METAGCSDDDRVPARLHRELDHAELVRRAQMGSASAFEQLVVSVGPSVHRYLSLRLRHEGDARDALQETLTAAWQGLPRLQQPGKFRSWVLGIATHKAADAKRNRLRSSEPELELQGSEDESLLEMREAILALPASFRDVLLLRYVVQLSEQEVAGALGVRVGTVKSRSARARKALEEMLR